MRKPASGAEMAWGVCLAQAAITVLVALTLYLCWGSSQAVAALYGGAIALVPTAYFARRVFARREQASPEQIVGQMLRGEIGKFALTAVMFAIGVKLFAKQFPALLIAYAACLLAYWLAMARAGLGHSDGI